MFDFEWDAAKDKVNRAKHGIGFELAQRAFLDPFRVVAAASSVTSVSVASRAPS